MTHCPYRKLTIDARIGRGRLSTMRMARVQDVEDEQLEKRYLAILYPSIDVQCNVHHDSRFEGRGDND